MKSSKFQLHLSLSCALLLAGCGQTPPPPPVVAPVSVPVVVTPEPDLAAEAQAEVFKLATQTTTSVTAPQPVAENELELQQRQLLTEAIQLLAKQQKPNRSLAITYHLRQSAYGQIRQQTQLPLLQSYLATGQFAELDQWLAQLGLTEVAPADRHQFTLLVAGYYQQQKQLLPALSWLLAQDELDGNAAADPALQELLWQHLVQLTAADIQQLSQTARPRAAAWLNLVQIALSFAGDTGAMQQALTDWQQRHPGMPTLDKLPASVNTLATTTPYQPSRIGVVLPLSGSFKALGEAVQLGLISANTNSTAPARTLLFVDSALSGEQLIAALETAAVDFVVGPLLREDVDKVQSLAGWRWPTLFLNSKQGNSNQPEQFYFALSAEDEATQMVDLFRQKHYQHPVLISARNPISQRMAQHFQQMWQQNGGKVVEAYSYNNQEELRELINTFLETASSSERVKEMDRLAGRSVKAEMHSRLDIDAIYLLADPAQTRLVKPFIDVTVSPTAPALPIYASSRSHSLAIDRTDIRDLAGLTITEIPWLVPQKTALPLRTEYEQLFAEQDETMQRLFAMGHDALSLIGRLKQQQQFPAMVYHGLTGTLRLTPEQNVQRQLTLAQYRGGKLQPLPQAK